MEATTKELRLRTKELLAATDRGEEVTITFRGEPRARLIGLTVPEKDARPERNPAFGIWSDRRDDVEEQLRMLRAPRRFARC